MKAKVFSFFLLLFGSFVLFSSCSDDDDEINGGQGQNAEKNTTDVAVSGNVLDVGAFYAQIKGVVNLDVITASYTKIEIGVEVSRAKDFSGKQRIKVSEVVGRTFNVLIKKLEYDAKYYYRTYVSVSSLSYDYYGETYFFTTDKLVSDFAVTGEVIEVGKFNATIGGRINVSQLHVAPMISSTNYVAYLEVSTLSDFSDILQQGYIGTDIIINGDSFYEYFYKSSDSYDFTVKFPGIGTNPLQPGTQYYYRTVVHYYDVDDDWKDYSVYGKTKSFTTKPLSSDFAVTGEVEEVGAFFAQIGGRVNLSDAEAANVNVNKLGIEISESEDFSKSSKLTATNSAEGFSCRFANLTPETKYYYRTYVSIYSDFSYLDMILYGETKSFTTQALVLDNPSHYVDLGLPSGTLWATMNVGAEKPEDYGDYFAWGETSTKSTYNWSTYEWTSGSSSTPTKYTGSSSTELELADDAAYVNWGSNWRMPSYDQFQELINSNYTTTTWTKVNGVSGRLIVSKTNNNSIFIPAAGWWDSSLKYAGYYCLYWSRNINKDEPSNAYGLYSSEEAINTYSDDPRSGRRYGLSIRPVRALE